MPARGVTTLGGRVVSALGRVALDAAADPLGRALPRGPEDLADAEVMTRLLGRPVASARLPGTTFESSNCRNVLVEVTEADGTVGTLYAKLPARELGPRAFANALGFWALECVFCERVAPEVPVRVPGVAAVARSRSRFVLLLEDLTADDGVELFTNRDMAAGTDLDRARRCLTAFAELHAHFHDWPADRRDDLLAPALHPYLPARQRPLTRALNGIAADRAHRRAPELVGADHVALVETALDRWDALLDHWYGGPLTLVHGDSHLANCFEYQGPDGPRVGFLDFQGVHWSQGIRDVAYFLIHSVAPDLLAAHEDELIDHYLGELAARGVALDPDDTRFRYRTFAFQPLMVGLVAVGLGGFTEREDTVRTFLTRELAAVDRLDVAGALDAAVGDV